MPRMKFIKPDPIKLRELRQDVDRGLLNAVEIVIVDMKLFTATWEAASKPKWQQKGPRKKGDAIELEYSTDSTPFVWVDEGTDGPYKIPKTPGFLRFQSGFTPKTTPGSLLSGPGSRFGPFVTARQVTHPGIEPRLATQKSADELNRGAPVISSLQHLVQVAIDKGKSY